MYDELQHIKEQLFDAPDLTKLAFNTVVEYFATGALRSSLRNATIELRLTPYRRAYLRAKDEYEKKKSIAAEAKAKLDEAKERLDRIKSSLKD